MGRKGAGVEVRPNSIRFTFLPGKPTLMVGGAPARPTAANVRWAHRLADEIRDRIRAGTFSMAEYFPASGTAGAPTTVADQLGTWLTAQRLEGSTQAGYSSAAAFWNDAPVDGKGTRMGDLPIRALLHSHVLTALASRPDLSGKTVNNYVSVLRQAMQLAVLDRALQANPVAEVPRAKWQRDPPDPFSREEAEAIIADLLAHYPEPVGNMVEWRFFSGVRTSEMAGLRWSSVDLAGGYVRISEANVRGVQKTTTKTATSRDVLLNSRSRDALQRQRRHSQMAGGHVWLDPRYGEPWLDERAFRRSFWTPSLRRLGIRYRAPNHARHTYATMMLMTSPPMNPAFCAGQMGHSVEVFLRIYSRWLRGAQDASEMQRLESALSSPALPRVGERGG